MTLLAGGHNGTSSTIDEDQRESEPPNSVITLGKRLLSFRTKAIIVALSGVASSTGEAVFDRSRITIILVKYHI